MGMVELSLTENLKGRSAACTDAVRNRKKRKATSMDKARTVGTILVGEQP